MRVIIFTLIVVAGTSASAQQNIVPAKANESALLVSQPAPIGVDVSWRYRHHNGRWWYWMPSNRWVIWDGDEWTDYVEPTYSVQPYTTYRYSQPYYGGNGGAYYPGYGAGIYLHGHSHYGNGHYGHGHGHYGHGHSHYGHGHGGHGHGGHGHGHH